MDVPAESDPFSVSHPSNEPCSSKEVETSGALELSYSHSWRVKAVHQTLNPSKWAFLTHIVSSDYDPCEKIHVLTLLHGRTGNLPGSNSSHPRTTSFWLQKRKHSILDLFKVAVIHPVVP